MQDTRRRSTSLEVAQDAGWLDTFADTERQRQRRHRAIVWTERVFVVCLCLGAWQALESFHVVKAILISSPWLLFRSLGQWVQQGSFYTDLEVTVGEMFSGLVLGTLLGVAGGVVLGLRPRVAKAVEPLVIALYSIPIVILVPLMTVWFGFGEFPKVLIVTLGVFFVMFMNALAGIRGINRSLIHNLRIMDVSRARIARDIYLPSIFNWMIAGLRIAVAFALIGAIVAEFVAAKHGLGVAMTNAALFLNVPRVFAALIVLAILGLVLSGLVSVAERRLLRWR